MFRNSLAKRWFLNYLTNLDYLQRRWHLLVNLTINGWGDLEGMALVSHSISTISKGVCLIWIKWLGDSVREAEWRARERDGSWGQISGLLSPNWWSLGMRIWLKYLIKWNKINRLFSCEGRSVSKRHFGKKATDCFWKSCEREEQDGEDMLVSLLVFLEAAPLGARGT